jgi:DNA-binding transcriptional LysR family regulator
MRINYDFGDLEAFLAVKETGSFHGAAEQLNLSQSAITRRIQKLEEALDSQLFERTTRSLKPTLAAKRLQSRAEAIISEAQETARAMRDESVAFAYQRGAVITLAAIPSVIGMLVSPAITNFRDTGHEARIRVIDASANEVAEAVASGEADFGISSIPMLEPSTEFEALFDDHIVLALAQSHPLATQGVVRLADLEDTPLIVPARGTGNRLLIDEAMARARMPLMWAFEVGRSTTALTLVQDGMGAALLPQSAIGTAQVTTCVLDELKIARPVGLLSRLGQRDSAAIIALKAAIRVAAKANSL